MEGKIKWWNSDKNHGYIDGEDGKEVYLNHLCIDEIIGNTKIAEGDRVIYSFVHVENGFIADNAKVFTAIYDEEQFRKAISKIDSAKYEAFDWTIEECEAWYNYWRGNYVVECTVIFKDLVTKGFARVKGGEHKLEIGYIHESGYKFTHSISIGIHEETFITNAKQSSIDIRDVLSNFRIIIEKNDGFNSLTMLLKYMDYIIPIMKKNEKLAEYEFVEHISKNKLNKFYKELFNNDTMCPLEIKDIKLEIWDKNNNVDFWSFEDLKVVVENQKDFEKSERNILVEFDSDLKFGYSNRKLRILKNDNDYKIYLVTSSDNCGGIMLELYNEEDYEKALIYFFVAIHLEDYISLASVELDYEKKSFEYSIETNVETLNPYDKLIGLIGLEQIKVDVINLVNLMKMQMKRKEQGLKPVPVSLHLVFSGNPGTGKTTVARILADIYKEIGILSKGHLVEVDRAGLVGDYIGNTALKTKEKIEEALGGILFIDEAYTLVKEGNDFGQEAIDTILKAMEDYREDFIVIVAGYPEQMQVFINSNPGLRSRFSKYIEFPDYSPEEMIEIFNSMCNEYEYVLNEESKVILKEKIYFLHSNKNENFANAREVRNLFEQVITNQATRLVNEANGNIMEITIEDFD